MQLRALTEKLAEDVSGRQERQSVNITKVEELICSQENALDTHKSPEEIRQITGIASAMIGSSPSLAYCTIFIVMFSEVVDLHICICIHTSHRLYLCTHRLRAAAALP